ncbi:hypothetical protein JCM3770_004629 [Rhodotorula araucariae]
MTVAIAFDVLGTCFSFAACRRALVAAFPTLSPGHAQSVIDDWFHAGQRDFTYLSMNGSYTPIAQVLRTTLPRILVMHGLVPPPPSPLTEAPPPSLTDPILSSIPELPPRPSLAGASALLLAHGGFRLLAATNGALATTRGLFVRALGADVADRWEYFSCDEGRVAKPAPEVYRDVWKRLGVQEGDEKRGWFVASHTWDLHAAKKAGFKTAFVSYEEHLALPGLFGTPDVVASDLEDAARQIIARETGTEP